MAEVPLSEEEVINAEETARLLGLDVLQVRRLAQKGSLPAYRLPGGRKYKFFLSEVQAFAASRPTEPDVADAEEPPAEVEAETAEAVPSGALAADSAVDETAG